MGLALLLLTKLVGEVRLGAQRWLDIPLVGSVQPSEFMKLAMPMMVAWFLSRHPLPPRPDPASPKEPRGGQRPPG